MVRTGENDKKSIMWMKNVFYFVFAELKTENFSNPLLWMRPKNENFKKKSIVVLILTEQTLFFCQIMK